MMIEAVPFFHILINTIESEIGDDVSPTAWSAIVHMLISLGCCYHRHNHGILRLQLHPDRSDPQSTFLDFVADSQV